MIFLIDKPKGYTSFDVVSIVKKKLQSKKAGHCGTLDPLATGMLPICIDEYTKIAPYISGQIKKYHVEAQLGVKTDTYDITGNIEKEACIKSITFEKIHSQLSKFIGKSEQIPPKFSAIKIKGKKAYELARKNIDIHLPPRPIEIISIENITYDQPLVRFDITCSKGTYIRTIIDDLGAQLQCGATMTNLRRQWVAPFTNLDLVDLPKVKMEHGISGSILFNHHICLSDEEIHKLRQGQFVQSQIVQNYDLVGIKNANNDFMGICTLTNGLLKPKKMLMDKFLA